jgi:hypothetical protein
LYQLNRPRVFSLFFGIVIFTSAQLTSLPPFSLLSVASHSPDVATPPLRATLPSHGVKTSSLHLLHLQVTLRSITFPLESKLKHWIRNTTTDHPPRTAQLSPSNAIKKLSQSCPLSPPLNRARLYFSSSLPRAPRHRSFTCRHHFLSPLSHANRSSTQRYP